MSNDQVTGAEKLVPPGGCESGAEHKRVGAFEEVGAGTLFLDEIGELPAELQPKLLRVLEEHEFRSVGGSAVQRSQARVIAATNRDLRGEVNAQRFRADLYFRLAVVKVPLPTLAQRPEDIPLLVAQLLETLGADEAGRAPLLAPRFLEHLQASAWPGNVRELRNHLERCLVLGAIAPSGEEEGGPPAGVDLRLSWEEAREQTLAGFERRYVEALLLRHQGKVPGAAQAAGMNPKYLSRLIQRHGLRRGPGL